MAEEKRCTGLERDASNDITESRSVADGELPAASIRGGTPFSGGRSSAPLRLPSGGSEFKAYQVYEHW
jgi:hypothetical protein